MESSQAEKPHPRNQIAEFCRHIYRVGLTTTSGGNLSILDDDGTIWVSPAAVDKGRLGADDVVGLHPDGTQSGERKASSETPFHRAIYRARPDLRAIIHAHPPALVAFSIARRQPDPGILPAVRAACGEVGYAPYALPGSEGLGAGIAAEFERGRDAVIMENHGAVVGGRDLLDAFTRFEALEFAARIEAAATSVGAAAPPPAQPDGTLRSSTSARRTTAESGHVQRGGDEREILARLARRAYEQGLTPSLACSMSLRCEAGFVLTPESIPCWQVEPEDMRFVSTTGGEDGDTLDRFARIHHAIYAKHSDIHSVIIAPPPHVMAFGVAGTRPDMRTIPESWILLQDIPSVEYGKPERDPKAFAGLFGTERPAALVRHDALYVTGATALQAFDRLEVAELSARALILGRQLGGVSPMDDLQVEALRQRFLAPGSPGLAVSEA